MANVQQFVDQNFTGSVAVTGFTYNTPPKPSSGTPPPFTAEWAEIKTEVGKLVPGAILKGQSPTLKEMLNALLLLGTTWEELATAAALAEGNAKTTLTDRLKSQAAEIDKSVGEILPVIAKQIALNDQQSKAGPFNTEATIQPGSAATYNTPLSTLRDNIHALNTKIGISIIELG
ncbi:hypothetical protein NUH88_06195 [Nisaea acidiphila]|uniref:Uncharacterized protein n=1 Tax=Nisaea acidiphila TaxID=1862145 RepID=A0A9J7AVC7_9PROT|nr:hypothetical protein [Nisaea acidiphila]UUX51280.1 hypothetical protein NUH88_06195 [Nisaea acidiphila]